MPENKIDSAVIGKYCIVRGDRFGVLAGTVEAVDGDRVLLKDARKLHYWDGAAAVQQLALDGTTAPHNCRFTVTVESILLTGAIEIIPATEKAKASICGVKVWKR